MSNIIRMIAAMIVFAAWSPVPAVSQQNQKSNPEDSIEQHTAPVILDGRTLFRVRGISSYPAEERAAAIRDRIAAIASDEKISAEELSIVEEENQNKIFAGERTLMAVVDADADIEGVTRQLLAQVFQGQIADAIKNYRRERSQSALLTKTAYSAGAIIISAVLLFIVVRLLRRLTHFLETRYRSKMQSVHIQSFNLIQSEHLWQAVCGIIYMVRTLFILTILLTCVEYVLSLYPWTRYAADRTFTMILDPLRSMGASILEMVPDLVFIAILALVVRYILKLTSLFFAGIANGTVTLASFDPDWATPTYKIVRLLAIAFAVVVAYPHIPGASSEAFKGVSIFVGVIFSLGSTSVVANTIAGYTMTYRRAFRLGDRVQIGDYLGDVEQVRLQVTHLRSLKNEEIVVPNSLILNSHVINYSTLARKQGLILHTTVGIGYETPWRQVESMLLMAAERTEGLLRNPSPFVLQKSLGDFCVVYEINAYCDRPQESARLYTSLHRNILDIFNEYGVQIMTPSYEGDPEQAKLVPRDKWFEAPASPPGPDQKDA